MTHPDGECAMAELYAGADVAEYWIVLPNERLIEIHHYPDGSRYREMSTFTRAEKIASESVPGLRFAFAAIFAALP